MSSETKREQLPGTLVSHCWSSDATAWASCKGYEPEVTAAASVSIRQHEVVMHIYEIDHCTAHGPCSTRHMTPTILLVCGEMYITCISYI